MRASWRSCSAPRTGRRSPPCPGREPAGLLVESVQASWETTTYRVDGALICIGGVVPLSLIGSTGVPWLMGTDLVPRHRRAFMQHSREAMPRWLAQCPTLRNVVDARYGEAIRWLRWLGFRFGPPVSSASRVCLSCRSRWRRRMCEPVTLALTLASTALSAFGQIQQQNAQSQIASANAAQARYQAQVAAQNQALMELRAADATQRGQVAEENRRRLTAQQTGQQLAGLASQGTDLEGSPTDILGDTAATGELDALTVRSSAAREAYGYKIQGQGYGNQSALETTRAANSSYTPNYLGTGASLLTGASALADKWRRFQMNNPSYTLSDDTLRTTGDRDLAGYN